MLSTINPQLSSNFRFTLTQHLLSGLGWSVNNRFIKIAKNNREITDVVFRQQLISTVTQIQNIYWDLVNAYEDVKVKERSLALAQKTLNDNQKQVEIGTLAPIEVVRAESQVAQSNQDLIVSQTNLQYQELLMKNAISRNLTDQVLVSAHVVPTDTTALPAIEPVVPTEDLVNEALSRRPELAISRINLQNRDISNKGVRNGLLPQLMLTLSTARPVCLVFRTRIAPTSTSDARLQRVFRLRVIPMRLQTCSTAAPPTKDWEFN